MKQRSAPVRGAQHLGLVDAVGKLGRQRAKTVDQDERGNAERRALFVGLWPPTIWLIGDSLAREE